MGCGTSQAGFSDSPNQRKLTSSMRKFYFQLSENWEELESDKYVVFVDERRLDFQISFEDLKKQFMEFQKYGYEKLKSISQSIINPVELVEDKDRAKLILEKLIILVEVQDLVHFSVLNDLVQKQRDRDQKNSIKSKQWKRAIEESRNVLTKFYTSEFYFQEYLVTGSQSCQIQLAYDGVQNQYLTLKRYSKPKDYYREKTRFKFIQTEGVLSYFFLPSIEFNDSNFLVIYQRGQCSLQQFNKLKRANNETFTPLEIFTILERVAVIMYEMFKQGAFLCDIKEEDLILCNEIGEDADEENNQNKETEPNQKKVYEIFINSVGCSYFLSEQFAFYPEGYTPAYFDKRKIDILKKGQSLDDFDTGLIIQSEIFVLARMIESLISHNLGIEDDFFNNSKVETLLDQHIKTISWEVSEILSKMIKQEYEDYEVLIREIQSAKGEYLKSHPQSDFLVKLTGLFDEKNLIHQGLSRLHSKEKLKREGMNLIQLEDQLDRFHDLGMLQNEVQILEDLESKLKSGALSDLGGIKRSEKLVEVYLKQSKIFRKQGAYDNALIYLDKALEQKPQAQLQEIYLEQALTFLEKNEPSRSIEILENCLQQKQTQNQQILTQIYQALSTAHTLQENYQVAIEIIKKAQDLAEKCYGPRSVDVAGIISQLANVQQSMGNFVKAENFFQQSLAIYEQELGPQHPLSIADIDSLANIYYQRGEFDKARDEFSKELKIMQSYYGMRYFETAQVMVNLGNINLNLGYLDLAETYIRAALQIEQEAFGPQHTRVGMTMWTLAAIFEQLEKIDDAKDMYLQCAEIWENNFGEDDPKTEEAKARFMKLCD